MLFYMIVQDAVPEKVSQILIEEALFVRIGQNDREALRELYEATERTMHAFVLSILKNPDDTADIVQDTYLKIRASAHLYEARGKPLAWMFTIARNLSINHLKKRNMQLSEDFEETIRNNINYSYVTDEIDRMVLAAALELLSEDERQTVLLHVLAGLRHREIAKNTGTPLSTILSRYNRAIKKLKAYLSAQGVIR